MIGKIILLPFRIVGGSLKLILTLVTGILGLLFKNLIGVIIGLVGGFFIAKKHINSECCCESDNGSADCNCNGDESQSEDKSENESKV